MMGSRRPALVVQEEGEHDDTADQRRPASRGLVHPSDPASTRPNTTPLTPTVQVIAPTHVEVTVPALRLDEHGAADEPHRDADRRR